MLLVAAIIAVYPLALAGFSVLSLFWPDGEPLGNRLNYAVLGLYATPPLLIIPAVVALAGCVLVRRGARPPASEALAPNEAAQKDGELSAGQPDRKPLEYDY